MVKKKFLLPDESFVSEDPYLIAAVLGGEYVGVAFHSAARTCGGAVSFRLAAAAAGGPPDAEGGGQKVVARCLDAFQQLQIAAKDLTAAVIGARSPAGAMPPGAFDANVKQVVARLKQAGVGAVREEVHEAEGAKVYFKNWDNSVRVITGKAPAFGRPAQPRGEGPVRVLIVDDSNLVLSILSRTIGQDPAFKIVGTASDAFAATETILDADPDVVILDVIMPQINGISFLANLMHYLPKPVIIFSTMGKSGGAIEKQANDAGAVDVIDKKSLNLSDPHSIDVIKAKVRAAATYMVMKKEDA